MSDSENENEYLPKQTTSRNMHRKSNPLSTRHLRLRYWTFYEEMHLVELWRKNLANISAYDTNLPVHREIWDGMRQRRINLDTRACRRRMHVLRNKYIAECKQLDLKGQSVSDTEWPLFQYIHSIFQPYKASPDLTHEDRTLEHVHANIGSLYPHLAPFKAETGYQRFQITHDPEGFPFLEAPSSATPTTYKTATLRRPNSRSLLLKQQTSNELRCGGVQQTKSDVSLPLHALQETTSCQPPLVNSINQMSRQRKFGRPHLLPLRGNITYEHIKQLRIENQRLVAQNENHRKQLQRKEQEYKELEYIFSQLTQHQEKVLQCLINRAVCT